MYHMSVHVGFITFAGFVMYCVFWLLYAFHLYLKVAQPKYSMQLDRLHRTTKFYYFEIVCIMTIGIVPYIVLASLSKFQIINFPPQLCGLGAVGTFYGIVFPTVVINCITVIILLLVLYHVHIVSDQ